MPNWKHSFCTANGIRFHYVSQGTGPLVLLLHGFPEFWYSWRSLLPTLSQEFQVVAPDLRGYGETDKPRSGYDLETLVADVVALVDALGHTKAHIVGHDWGGAIAWWAAMRHPERFHSLSVLNAPHPAAMVSTLLKHPTQIKRSSYMLFFQLNYFAEWFLSKNNYRAIQQSLRHYATRPIPDEDIKRYQEEMAKPKALTSALAYYRSVVRTIWKLPREKKPILLKTLVLWGEDDKALGTELLDNLHEYAPNLTIHQLANVGHFPAQEAPEEVVEKLLPFLQQHTPTQEASTHNT